MDAKHVQVLERHEGASVRSIVESFAVARDRLERMSDHVPRRLPHNIVLREREWRLLFDLLDQLAEAAGVVERTTPTLSSDTTLRPAKTIVVKGRRVTTAPMSELIWTDGSVDGSYGALLGFRCLIDDHRHRGELIQFDGLQAEPNPCDAKAFIIGALRLFRVVESIEGDLDGLPTEVGRFIKCIGEPQEAQQSASA